MSPASSPSARDLLTLAHVEKRFGGVQAVTDCSFAIREGSITGLIGPNGAGKTTVFNMIAGAFAPTSGTIRLDGEEITGLPAHRLFARGLVRTFQIPHEFHRMTCLENLMLVPEAQTGETLWNAWLRWGRVRGEERRLRQDRKSVV